MPIRVIKPTSSGSRHKVKSFYSEVSTKSAPIKFLTTSLPSSGGRGNDGRISVRHIHKGNKKKYRIIDFNRFPKLDLDLSRVETVEYDPNRTSFIASIRRESDSHLSYIVAYEGIKVGDILKTSSSFVKNPKSGDSLLLKDMPIGINVYNLEFVPGKGGQIAKSAGSFVSIVGKENGFVIIKMPSGELRKFSENCRATVGEVSNKDHVNEKLGKAGASWAIGRRPTVRGIAMNPVDHPHGGRSNGGRHPCSPTGVLAKGKKTANKKRVSPFVIKKRK